MMAALTKMMIVNLLGRRLGFSRYMELATPSTGRFYRQVDRGYFDHVSRMMYLTPFVVDDGLPVDFRSPDEDLTGVLEECRALGHRMDISLVDGWHTYPTALRDLREMFALLTDGGVLVVHDCLPESREGASPRFRKGAWWGQSYKAFLDFVLQTPGLDYLTLDCDHGCGLIIKNRQFDAVLGQDVQGGWLPVRPDADLAAQWLKIGPDADLAYTFFDARRDALLRKVAAERFLSLFPAEALDLARKAMDLAEPPPKPRSSRMPPPVPPKRPGPAIRFQRYLNRKHAEMAGQTTGVAPSHAGDPDKAPGES